MMQETQQQLLLARAAGQSAQQMPMGGYNAAQPPIQPAFGRGKSLLEMSMEQARATGIPL